MIDYYIQWKEAREQAIKNDLNGIFNFASFEKGDGSKEYGPPFQKFHERALASLAEHDLIIQVVSQENGLNIDFLKSIIYFEVAYGSRNEGALVEGLGLNDSQLPANINLELWGALTPLKYLAEVWTPEEISIATAGVLLGRIQERLEVPNFEAIATLYNYTGNTVNSSYGLTIGQIYRDTPWDEQSDNWDYPSLSEQERIYHASQSEEEVENLADQPINQVELTVHSEQITEGGILYFKVSIEGGAVEHDITFQATTFQGTTSNFNPDGSSPDYNGVNGTWTIKAGETHVLIPVQTDEDNVHEGTETLELHVTAIEGANNETLIATGTIIDDDPAGPRFEAANFSTDLSSVLATADYTLSHDGVGDQENVVVAAYVDTNGNRIWDSSDAQVGYENAYKLRDDENDNEEIELTGLRDHLGDQTLFLTVQSDEVDEHVLVTEEVTVEAVEVNFTLDDFEWTADGAETRVDYHISHDLNGDVSGVRVRWYADANGNGTWDDGDDYLGYESAGTLRDGEVDSEGETLEDLGDYDGQGDVFIFTTIEADGIEEHVHREDVVDMGNDDGPDIDLSIEDITFRDDRLLTTGQDVRADFVVVNSGSESTRGMDERTGIFWSVDDHFDFKDDVMIDYDTHGTLYAGEHDSEYERTHYEDIPEGQGYLFYVVDPHNSISETNEMNNISDPFMVWVL